MVSRTQPRLSELTGRWGAGKPAPVPWQRDDEDGHEGGQLGASPVLGAEQSPPRTGTSLVAALLELAEGQV